MCQNFKTLIIFLFYFSLRTIIAKYWKYVLKKFTLFQNHGGDE